MNAPLHFELGLLIAREETSHAYGAPPPEETTDWKQVHQRIQKLGRERAAHEREVCRWLCAASRLGVATRAGYASLDEYALRVIGLKGRQTEERLRVGRALVALPVLDGALASGEFCWSTVRELTRIATPETEEAWRDWARHKTSRQVEKAVATRTTGDTPDDGPDPTLIQHRLVFEVRAETMALFRDLQTAVQRDLGEKVDDDVLLYEIARRALGGPDDKGRASYQVAVNRCDACLEMSIDAGGEQHAVDRVIEGMVACDSQVLPHSDKTSENETSSIPHVGATPQPPANNKRATQTIPPATRREVMRRDHECCIAPGCRNHRFLDVHHVDLRSEGGGHDPARLAVLCGSHHRRVHAGTLNITGSATAGFVFRHADGRRYGQAIHPAAIEVAQKAFTALRHMGFKDKEVRARITAVQQAGAPEQLEDFLRAALR